MLGGRQGVQAMTKEEGWSADRKSWGKE